MTDEHGRHAAGGTADGAPEGLDHEIGVRGIVYTAVGIVAVTVASMLVVWWLVRDIKGNLVKADRGPTAVERQRRAEAQGESAAPPAPVSAFPNLSLPAGTVMPPGPRLQPSPDVDMDDLLEAENRELASYGWVDRDRGVVRIPIDEAMERMVAEGLPQFTPPPAADAGAPPESAAAAGAVTAEPPSPASTERNPRR
jgi:hypothetical protein